MTSSNKILRMKKLIQIIAYLSMILYITLGIRGERLTTGFINTTLFRSLHFKNYNGIILNIALFIPLGYFLTDLIKKKWIAILIAIFISLAIETLQYHTGRGQLSCFNKVLPLESYSKVQLIEQQYCSLFFALENFSALAGRTLVKIFTWKRSRRSARPCKSRSNPLWKSRQPDLCVDCQG